MDMPIKRSGVGPVLLNLFAQSMFVASLVLPLAWNRGDAIVALAVGTTIAGAASHTITLAIRSRLPTEPSDDQARTAVVACGTTAVIAGILLSAFVAVLLSLSFGEAMGVLSVVLSLGLLTIVSAVLIRRHDLPAVARVRLANGSLTMLATLLACVLGVAPSLFLLATAVGNVAGCVAGTRLREIRIVLFRMLHIRAQLRASLRYAWDGRPLVVASVLSGLSGFGISFVISSASDDLQVALASVVRVLSGLQNLGANVAGPSVDIRVASAYRMRKPGLLREALRLGIFVGVALSAGGLLAAGALTQIVVKAGQLDSTDFFVLVIASIGLGLSGVGLSCVWTFLGMIGEYTRRLRWDLVRGSGYLTACFLSEQLALVVLGVVGLVSFFHYVAEARLAVSQLGSQQHHD